MINRTNSKELVGKTAIFNENEEYTFASYLIRVKLDTTKVNIDYINSLFNSQLGRIQIDMTSRQILGQANINSQEMRDFIFPIPPLKIQNQIAKKITKMKNEIKSLNTKAKQAREEAIKEFDEELFSK
ncbi:MAG: hypothetical protein GY936_16180 [Ignavibacteriae bacterium]|nr:hypothetical protein [Ignavibacteriota bacterium]